MSARFASHETIFALASAPGRAGVAVVRVSGPLAGAVLASLAGPELPLPRVTVLKHIRSKDGAVLDQGLVLWFPGPASYTGEDCAEFHIHGGRAVLDGLFEAFADAGLRPAEAGEFTRRAVENGKLDLTRAEAIADLVAAETEVQRRQAVRQYEGGLEELYDGWRARLIRAAAWTEAAIDFSDEELPEDVMAKAQAAASEIAVEIQGHIRDSRRGELVRDGLFLTVIGPPNVGKSSLVNALVQRDVAIVSETAGTTRDVIEVHLNLGGYPVILADTAGLRLPADAIEAEGVRRALARAAQADMVLLLLDGSASEPLANVSRETLASATIVAWNKADLPWPTKREGLALSLKTGAGLSDLIAAIARKAKERMEGPRDAVPLTRARHRYALEEALGALRRAISATQAELRAEDLRLALRSIGRITGRVDIEELLDVVFRDFCIGK
jgi:tRNA modification GTPase